MGKLRRKKGERGQNTFPLNQSKKEKKEAGLAIWVGKSGNLVFEKRGRKAKKGKWGRVLCHTYVTGTQKAFGGIQ